MLSFTYKKAHKKHKNVNKQTAIMTDMGLDTPPLKKPLETNLQNITGNIFQTTTNQLMTPMPSPKLSNCRFRVSGQDG